MMHQVYRTLPDDRPITSIHIVEDPEKCPSGFVVVSRTHDQDSDADLWREGRVFGRKVTRYICLSKSEGLADYIVESVVIMNEKDTPPDGYSVLMRTADSEQRAWRKRQLCYKLTKPSKAKTVITDIIVLSRTKRAPSGFSLAGEINGMTLCYKSKLGSNEHEKALSPSRPLYRFHQERERMRVFAREATQRIGTYFTSLSHFSSSLNPTPSASPAALRYANGEAYPFSPQAQQSPHEYERLIELRPSRPAPKPPATGTPGKYATIAAYNGLEGVPFVISSSFQSLSNGHSIPIIKSKTKYQLDKEYNYDFRIERQT